MKLTMKCLDSVFGLNAFTEADEYSIDSNDDKLIVRLFCQLPCGTLLRYIPTIGSTVEIVSTPIDDSKDIKRLASTPFPDDRSIYQITILPEDKFAAGSISAILTEGGLKKIIPMSTIMTVLPKENKGFYC